MTVYRNVPLDASRREVRILTLCAGGQHDTIRCSLAAAALNEATVLEALSYTWGNVLDTVPILVDDKQFSITHNLRDALLQLRKPKNDRHLWVDAVCINQRDDDEKSNQIQMMRDIYATAGRVLVWLGPALGDSDLVMDLLDQYAETPGSLMDTAKTYLLLGALTQILSRSWWTRVWIVQELAAGSEDPLVGCGSKWQPWTTIVQVLDHLAMYRNHKGVSIANSAVLTLNRARTAFHTKTVNHEASNLQNLLLINNHRESTNPKDVIYGMLGLIDSIGFDGGRLIVDYSKSLREVYGDACKYMVMKPGQLNWLTFTHAEHAYHDLPSWMPDFSMPHRKRRCFLHRQYQFYKAAGDIRSRVTFSRDMWIFTAQGLYVDAIDDLVYTSKATLPADIDKIQDLATSKESSKEDLWRTLVADKGRLRDEDVPKTDNVETTPAPAEFRHQFEVMQGLAQVPDDFAAAQPPLERLKQYTWQYRDSMYSAFSTVSFSDAEPRCFFTTKGGRLGLGPPTSKVGDIVCILFGAEMPYVVRKQDDGSCWFLGEAYVHGIMHGEFVELAQHAPSNLHNPIDFVFR